MSNVTKELRSNRSMEERYSTALGSLRFSWAKLTWRVSPYNAQMGFMMSEVGITPIHSKYVDYGDLRGANIIGGK